MPVWFLSSWNSTLNTEHQNEVTTDTQQQQPFLVLYGTSSSFPLGLKYGNLSLKRFFKIILKGESTENIKQCK